MSETCVNCAKLEAELAQQQASSDAEYGAVCVELELARHSWKDERADTLTFLRRHERDQLLGIEPPTLAKLIAALERGEHR